MFLGREALGTLLHRHQVLGSAVADSGAAAFAAVKDFVQGNFQAETTHRIGLENPQAVRLTLADDVPNDVRDKIKQLTGDIVAKKSPWPPSTKARNFPPHDLNLPR